MRQTYFAPTASEYRRLAVEQTEDGAWEYEWGNQGETGGFATEGEAFAAAMVEGNAKWPGIRLADGTENAYGAILVHDDTGI